MLQDEISPLKKLVKDLHWEEFCRVKILTLSPRSSEINRKMWSTMYNSHLEEINADPIDILRSPIDDAESEIIDEEEVN